ncbi:MAG: site-specific integrase [Cyclobacteriaceae bacterium]|nr:site-specific integrase [Cyclobacteriaceae bacterium]
MNKTFNVLFHLKKPKNYTKGLIPIYMRLTVDGQRFEMHINRECNPENWNSASGRMAGNREEAKALNIFLDLMKSKVFEAQRELMSAGYEVTALALKNKLAGKEERQKTLLEVYQYHNQQFEELVGKEFSEGTLKKFKTCFTSLETFIKWKTGQTDLPLKSLTHQFIVDYEFYLKTVQSIQHNTAMGYIKKLKKIVRQCVANDWLSKDPFMSYKIKIRDTHRNFLLEDELKRLEEKKILIERLSVVRDIFLFSCYTGLAYSDVEKLTANDISIGIDGEKWIFTNRTKTETSTRVPLLPPALSILEKYANSPVTINSGKLLPMLSNQRMNSYLKELADICDIKKELTFHCARHTFATTVTLTNGVPIETVSKMLGHRSLRTTQQYAKIIDLKVSQDMSVLKTIFRSEKPKDSVRAQSN